MPIKALCEAVEAWGGWPCKCFRAQAIKGWDGWNFPHGGAEAVGLDDLLESTEKRLWVMAYKIAREGGAPALGGAKVRTCKPARFGIFASYRLADGETHLAPDLALSTHATWTGAALQRAAWRRRCRPQGEVVVILERAQHPQTGAWSYAKPEDPRHA